MSIIRFLSYVMLFFLVAQADLSFAQNRGGAQVNWQPNGKIYGSIIDSASSQTMEYVTISIKSVRKDSVVSGGISDDKGKFEIGGLFPGPYKIEFAYIGYHTLMKSIVINPNALIVDLGNIAMYGDSEALEEAKVVGTARKVTYEIDKRIIHVSDLNTVMSESAVEVLQSVPGINVNIAGDVSLRGSSNFTLLIDGKPTVLDIKDALQQIPASTIEDIEIITNPSAKYEAEGVSGIINIKLKRNKLRGLSGLLNLNGGTYDQYGGNAVLSMNSKKVTINLTGSYNTGDRPSFEQSIRTTIRPSGIYTLESNGLNSFVHGGYGVNGEVIYRMNPLNTLTIGGNLGRHGMESNSTTDFQRKFNGFLEEEYSNAQEWMRDGAHNSINAAFQHVFPKNNKHTLDFTATYNIRNGVEESESLLRNPEDEKINGQRVTEVGPNNMIRMNLDYVLPIKKDHQIELGTQVQFGRSGDETESFFYDTIANDFVRQAAYSYNIDYIRDIYGFYGMYEGKSKKLGYQVGLRTEYTNREISIVEQNNSFLIDRWDFFPTLHFSYQLPKDMQLMLSYSRRIQRPRSWYLEPFVTWTDAFNARSGNPSLKPEYIDAYEMSWVREFSKKGSISIELYGRQSHNNIERISTALDSNVLLTAPANVGTASNYGSELSVNYVMSKSWVTDFSGSFYEYIIKGSYQDLVFDNQSFSYNLRWNNTFSLGKAKLQLENMYQSRIVSAQGERSGFWSLNASVRHSFFKNKLSLTAQMRDVFSTTLNENTIIANSFSSYNLSEPRTPTFSIALALKLNNYNSRMQRNRGGQGGDDDF